MQATGSSHDGRVAGVVSASQPLGSDNRITLCQAEATWRGSGAEW